MERWARGPFGAHVRFVCACVDAQSVAVAFGKMFQLAAVVNAHIPSREHFPDFGQLGCSGFIVVDQGGRCVSRKTASFLQQGPDAAFADVERLLRSLVGEPAPAALGALPADSPYAAGAAAVLEGLAAAPALNGQRVVVRGFDTAKGRFVVALEAGGQQLAVRPCNLAPPPGGGGGGGAGAPAALAAIAPPPATGCAAIDEEHGACAAALNAALARPDSGEALAHAVEELAAHFSHEEALLAAAGWGGDGGPLSARGSHVADHARILAPARAELQRLAASGLAGRAEPRVARALAAAFSEHAAAFDARFEGQLPCDAR
jgi:hypothetical protein